MADFRLRVTYAETGRLVMLSHLEVARALERAVRRAGLPYAITQGFSPHMKLAFGAALPVGVGGTCEIFDVNLTDYVPPERVLAALREASVPDLMPYEARYIAKEDAAASVAFPRSTYEVWLAPVSGERAASVASAADLTLPDEIRVVRKKKEKVLRPADFLIGGLLVEEACAPASVHAPEGARCVRLEFTLEAKPSGSLRPDVLLETMLEGTGLAPVSIMRIAQAEVPAE